MTTGSIQETIEEAARRLEKSLMGWWWGGGLTDLIEAGAVATKDGIALAGRELLDVIDDDVHGAGVITGQGAHRPIRADHHELPMLCLQRDVANQLRH